MYQQKMCYIDLYKNGLKCGNMGHVRMEWDNLQYRFQTSLCRLDRQTLVSVMIKRNGVETPEKLHDIEVIHGKGQYHSDWIPMWGDEKELAFEASGGVYGTCILPDMGIQDAQSMKKAGNLSDEKQSQSPMPEVQDDRKVSKEPQSQNQTEVTLSQTTSVGNSVKDKESERKQPETADRVSTGRQERLNHVKAAEAFENKSEDSQREKRDMLEEIRKEREILAAVPLLDNKWNQLCSMYEKVRPVAGNMEFIKIKPEDFIILRQEYQGLVKNSFLLHGYYNYHYILLGKYPDKYYLGVPGIMHEQERLAAAMFGFIGFERAIHMPDSELEGTDFGYYMMEVAI